MSLKQFEVHAKTQAFMRHVNTATRELEHAATLGRVVVSMSWGKDSCALGDLACRVLGRVDMMHMACAHELPGGERVVEHFEQRATIHELPPLNSLEESVEWLKIVGLPHERERGAHQRIIQTRKRDRGEDWATDHGYAVTVLGMRAEESVVRRRLFARRGLTYQRASGHWASNPLGWWKVQDVWAYLVSRGVPWHPLYDAETHGYTRERLRNGGWLYTDGAPDGWVVWLRHHYPEQYRALVTAFPRMRQHT